MIAGYLIACRIRLTQGDIESAAGYLEQARSLVEQSPPLEGTSRFERLKDARSRVQVPSRRRRTRSRRAIGGWLMRRHGI